MAGQGRTLLVLGGVLVAGIAAACWLLLSEDGDEPMAGGGTAAPAVATAPETGKGAPAASHAKKSGTASLFGEIRRTAGKAPVAGQEVLLTPARGDPWRVATDAQGAFRFDQLPHGEPFELSAAAKGCGTIRIPGIALDRNEKRNVGTLYLDPSVKVTVRVRSGADAPVEGAVVEAFPVAQFVDWDWSKALAQIGQAPISVAKCSTDGKGEAVFPEMAVGEWTFAAHKDGFAPGGERGLTLRSDEEPPPVVVYLLPGYPLDGRVLAADGKPVAQALVMAGAVDSGWDLASAPLRGRATTDAEGRYAFAALESGDAQLWVGKPGGVPTPSATVRIPLVPHYDIVLKGGGTLGGAVTYADGDKPVEGATVRATSWESNAAHSGEAVTDAEGRYSLEMAEGAINQLTAEKEGLVQVKDAAPAGGMNRQAVLHEGATVVRNLKMRRGAHLTGVVKGDAGPLAGARVLAAIGTPNEGFNQKTVTTGADGRYEFAAMDKGSLLLLVEKDGWYLPGAPENWWEAAQEPESAKEFKVDVPETGEATKDFEMKRGSLVSGTVVGPDGNPLAGARVGAPGADDARPTGADGAFRLEGVKPGDAVALSCGKEGFVQAAAKPIPVVADQPATGIVLKMLREPHVSGRVTAADGSALRDARVLLANKRAEDDESPWSEQWRWQNATRVPVRPDGTYDAPVPFSGEGALLVRGVSLDQQRADAKPVDLVEGQESYHVDLVLAEGTDLAGKVVTKGGAPVGGADVSIAAHHDANVNGVFYGGGNSPSVWAVSGADGTFRVPHLAPGKYDVRADARGYVTADLVADLAVATPVTVEMSPEMTIEGKVVLASGAPVEGVEVHATTGGDGVKVFGGFVRNEATATTDGTGAFSVTGVGDGRYTISVQVPWGAEINVRTKKVPDVAAGTKDLRVTIDEGGRIGGHLVDAKRRPVTNAWITANAMPKEGAQPDDGQWHGTQAKPDGTFVIVGLGDGPYSLDVSSNSSAGGGFRPKHVNDVAVGTKDAEVVLEEGMSITGVVVGPDGKSVGQMAVEAVAAEPGEDEDQQSTSAWTDGQGKFTLAGLAPGAYRITVAPWGGSNQGWIAESNDPIQAGATGVRVAVAKGVTITGVVVDENGKPIAGAQITAGATKGDAWKNTTSKEDGTFEVAGLGHADTYTVSARAPGRVPFKLSGLAAGATVRIVMAKGLQAKGRVVDAAGKAMAGAGLTFAHSDGVHSQAAQTDAEGRFDVDGLVDGAYAAQVYVEQADGKGDWKPCGSLKAGDTEADLRVQQ